MPTRTGTASEVDASASGSTSVTVPSDATLVVATWGGYTGAGTGMASITLDGDPFTIQTELTPGAEHGTGVATLLAPSTGSQTLAWSWTDGNGRSEGGGLVLTYVKDHNTTTPIRDYGTDSGTDTANVEVTVDSDSTDLVIAHMHSPVGSTPDLAGTQVAAGTINSGDYETCEVTASATSTTCTMTGEYYSTIVAISLPEAGAAGATGASDLAVTVTVDSGGTPTAFGAADAPITVTVGSAGGTFQTLYPSADSDDGNWTDDGGGTSLAAAINEETPSDSEYIQSEGSPTNSGCRVKLDTSADPESSTGHQIQWRIGKDETGGSTINMTVKLMQGGGDTLGAGTEIASFDRNDVDAMTTMTEVLSGAEADSITDYGDLYLEFYADTA